MVRKEADLAFQASSSNSCADTDSSLLLTTSYDYKEKYEMEKMAKENASVSFKESQEQVKSLLQVNDNLMKKITKLLCKKKDKSIKSTKEKISNKIIEDLTIKIDLLESQLNSLQAKYNELERTYEESKNNKPIITPAKILTPQIQLIESNNEDEVCVYLKFSKEGNDSYFEKAMMRSKDTPFILSSKETGLLKCFNVEWVEDNFEIIINICSKILFQNIDKFKIRKSIIFTRDILLKSNGETKLEFSNSQNITISGDINVEMIGFNIFNCRYGDDSVINLENCSSLVLRQSQIRNNIGERAIVSITGNSDLELEKVIFESNQSQVGPSCISSESQKNIIIRNCKFLNHTSSQFPKSAFLIESQGNLSIFSSEFKNNIFIEKPLACINSIGEGVISIEGSKFFKCCHLNFKDSSHLYVNDCSFLEIANCKGNGGALYIERAQDVNIDNSVFNENVSGYVGGSIYFHNSSSAILKNCSFEGNKSGESYSGGAICFWETPCIMQKCVFTKNSSRYGGAVCTTSTVSAEHCTFDSNMAAIAGAICEARGGIFINSNSNLFKGNISKNKKDIDEV